MASDGEEMRAAPAILALLTMSCFGGYQPKAPPPQTPQNESPALREAANDAPKAKTHRVHAYVTRTFMSEVGDAPRSIRELFDEANEVMEPLAGVHLELDGVRTWELAKDDDLTKALADLRTTSAGDDASWVVGFVSAMPKASTSFHDVGTADLPGKHIVVRAPSSTTRDRAEAGFLHEIGHTLGALHERSEGNLMFPEYRSKTQSFSDTAAATMRMFVDRRDPKTLDEQRSLVVDLAAQINKAPNGIYIEAERTKQLESFDAFLARTAKNAPAKANEPTPAAPPAEPDDLAKLSAADRATFADARAKAAHGDLVGAWETGKPLYSAYLEVMSVQDFRCETASKVFKFETARRECEPLMQLAKQAH